MSEENPDDEAQKNSKKKRIRFKRQKAINSGPNADDVLPSAVVNEPMDSLKLFGVGKLPKPQKLKAEPKKKFRRCGIVATATIHVSKNKNKTIMDNLSDSSSSEDAPTTSNRPRTNKKKKKPSLPKKRALSANFLLSDK